MGHTHHSPLTLLHVVYIRSCVVCRLLWCAASIYVYNNHSSTSVLYRINCVPLLNKVKTPSVFSLHLSIYLSFFLSLFLSLSFSFFLSVYLYIHIIYVPMTCFEKARNFHISCSCAEKND